MKKHIRQNKATPDIEVVDNLSVSVETSPLTHSLDLTTHPAVSSAWEHFFALCWDWWEEIERRRKPAGETRTISSDCSNHPQSQ